MQHAVEVVAPEAMQAAVEAAAELARASSRNRSLITALIKEGKGTGGAIRVEVTPVARPAGASAVGGGGSGPGVDGETEGGDMGGELTVEEERLIASGRGGLGALLSLSSFSSSGGSGGGGAMLRPSASISSLPSLDASASGAGADEQGAAARRSSLGLIWGYLSRGKEDGSGGNGEQPQQQQQGAQAGGEAGPLRADVEHVVAMVERLEDELAHMTVKKEQAEAEAVIALAKQRRWSIEKERFERRMNEALARWGWSSWRKNRPYSCR